jgi:2-polyprenyl-6-methoxyphenol hydroxylase-like FAD-dependent oxidoreductase
LVGDAAGFGDPLLGQGLSMTFRDARLVRDLILDGATTPAAFASYADERLERVKRYGLIADILAVANAEDCTNRTARQHKFNELMARADSSMGQLVLGSFTGPEAIPDDAVDTTLPDQIRAAT